MILTIATLDPRLKSILLSSGWTPAKHVGSVTEYRWNVALLGWPAEPYGLEIALGNRTNTGATSNESYGA